MKRLEYLTEADVFFTEKGKEVFVDYLYSIGEDIYSVSCVYKKDKAETYGPILNAIMDSYTITRSPDETAPANPYPGVVLYKGTPVHWLLGQPLDDVESVFGNCLDYSHDEDEGTVWREYAEASVSTDDGPGYIESFYPYDPSSFVIDGTALNMNRAGLVALLGAPTWENLEDAENYYMIYDRPDGSYFFSFDKGPDESADLIGAYFNAPSADQPSAD